jgi:SAM-dependent methyltransferase
MAIPSFAHQHLVRQMTKQLGTKDKLIIIDYGCGAGALLDHIPSNIINTYTCYEVSSAALDQAKKIFSRRTKYRFYAINQKKLPTFGRAKSVDVIVLVGVWQYLQPYEQQHVLKEASRTLKQSGLLIISCSLDHKLYKWLNIYRYFVPHYYVNRATLTKQLTQAGFELTYQQEKGLIINPLFSNIITFFSDAIDRFIFKTRGTLGPVGQKLRTRIYPLLAWENNIDLDYGYTLYLTAKRSIKRVKRRSTKK